MMTCIFALNGIEALIKEIKLHKNTEFYLSGTMIEPNSGHIVYNFGTI